MNEDTSEKQVNNNKANIDKYKKHLHHHTLLGLIVANGLRFSEKQSLLHAASGEIWRNPFYLFGWFLLLANVLMAIKSALVLRKAQFGRGG